MSRLLDADDPRHGTRHAYINFRCRCDFCRDANAAYHKARRLGGLLSQGDPRHGTANGYFNYACRCAPCKSAGSAQNRRSRERRKGRAA